jgi:hypothetical protein
MSTFKRLAEAFSEILSALTVLGLLGLCLIEVLHESVSTGLEPGRSLRPNGPATIDELIEQKYRQEQN